MSSKVATLLVGLLAFAEGRTNDTEMLREANNDDVLDMISPQMLDRIAQRLYAEDEAHLSAYERLLESDKREKMNYLSSFPPTERTLQSQDTAGDHILGNGIPKGDAANEGSPSLNQEKDTDARRRQKTERLAAALDQEQARIDRDRKANERELRRQQRERAKQEAEEKQKAEDEAYKAMLDEEHRHEERQQRRKERQIEREKRQEDRRRKQWEEYEKCIEREVELGQHQHCSVPSFHQRTSRDTRGAPQRREVSLEPAVSQETSEAGEEAWSQDEDADESQENDYFSAPFSSRNMAFEVENEKVLTPAPHFDKPLFRKPKEETIKQPNSPWTRLAASELRSAGDNDINFDVDQHFKFRMPTDANFRGHDVKFNVKLPPDLLGGTAATPAARPGQRSRPTGPGAAALGNTERQIEDYVDEYDDEEYSGDYSDEDEEYDQFAHSSRKLRRYAGKDYMLTTNGQPTVPITMNLRYAPVSQYADDYLIDRRHRLSQREQMWAMEPEPQHFYEPAYFSEDDANDFSDDEYYEDLIGYEEEYDSEERGDSDSFYWQPEYDPNDILFAINENVQFKLEAEDNYEGRDIDIGITMPGSAATAASGPNRKVKPMQRPIPKAQPAPQPTTQPVTQPATQPTTQPATQPVAQPATQPVAPQQPGQRTEPYSADPKLVGLYTSPGQPSPSPGWWQNPQSDPAFYPSALRPMEGQLYQPQILQAPQLGARPTLAQKQMMKQQRQQQRQTRRAAKTAAKMPGLAPSPQMLQSPSPYTPGYRQRMPVTGRPPTYYSPQYPRQRPMRGPIVAEVPDEDTPIPTHAPTLEGKPEPQKEKTPAQTPVQKRETPVQPTAQKQPAKPQPTAAPKQQPTEAQKVHQAPPVEKKPVAGEQGQLEALHDADSMAAYDDYYLEDEQDDLLYDSEEELDYGQHYPLWGRPTPQTQMPPKRAPMSQPHPMPVPTPQSKQRVRPQQPPVAQTPSAETVPQAPQQAPARQQQKQRRAPPSLQQQPEQQPLKQPAVQQPPAGDAGKQTTSAQPQPKQRLAKAAQPQKQAPTQKRGQRRRQQPQIHSVYGEPLYAQMPHSRQQQPHYFEETVVEPVLAHQPHLAPHHRQQQHYPVYDYDIEEVMPEELQADQWPCPATPSCTEYTALAPFDEEGELYEEDLDYEYGPQDLAMYQDGIVFENPVATPTRRRRRRGAGQRRAVHRYPHLTHQRRATEHSFADQGPTHFGQQHPIHEDFEEGQLNPASKAGAAHPSTRTTDKATGKPAPSKRAPGKAGARHIEFNAYDSFDSEDDRGAVHGVDFYGHQGYRHGFRQNQVEFDKEQHYLQHEFGNERLTNKPFGYGRYEEDLDYADEDDFEEEENVGENPLFDQLATPMEINIEISERRNEIIEIPDAHDVDQLRHESVHAKVDNDMESSDLGFSEGRNEVDEHALEIEKLGHFEIDRSVSDQIVGINNDESFDFSQGEFSDADLSEGQFSREPAIIANQREDEHYSRLSDTSGANTLSSEQTLSVLEHEEADQHLKGAGMHDQDWDTFIKGELGHGGLQKPPELPKTKPSALPAAQPGSKPQIGPAKTQNPRHFSQSQGSSEISSSSSSSSSFSDEEDLHPAARRQNELGFENENLTPRIPKRQQNFWRNLDTSYNALYERELDSHDVARSEGYLEHDLDDFDHFRRNQLNLSMVERELTNENTLQPRFPRTENDKSKNKRPQKSQPTQPVPALTPKIKEEEIAKRQAPAPRKPYQGTAKKIEAPKYGFKHPSPVGLPLQPVLDGHEVPRGTKKQLGSTKMVKGKAETFKEEQEVVYDARRVDRFASADADIDAEDGNLNFKRAGFVPETHSKLLKEARKPDEFHNVEFQREHHADVQQAHYDEFEPETEHFFGSYGIESQYVVEPLVDHEIHVSTETADAYQVSHHSQPYFDVELPFFLPHENERAEAKTLQPVEVEHLPEINTAEFNAEAHEILEVPLDISGGRSPYAESSEASFKKSRAEEAAYSGYFDRMFQSVHEEQHEDDIGDLKEQTFFQQDVYPGEAHALHPYDSYSSYYEQLQHEERDEEASRSKPPAWEHVEPKASMLSLDSAPRVSEYLALYGASELFAQLDETAPRPLPSQRGQKRGTGRKRTNGLYSNEYDAQSDSETASNVAGAVPALNGYMMNLYGANELYAQLQAENGLGRRKNRWTPRHRRGEEEEQADLSVHLNALQ